MSGAINENCFPPPTALSCDTIIDRLFGEVAQARDVDSRLSMPSKEVIADPGHGLDEHVEIRTPTPVIGDGDPQR